MKRITLVLLLLPAFSLLPAQTALRHINRNAWRSEFLQAVSVHPVEYGEAVFAPVYSWLSEKVPSANWVSYGGRAFCRNYKVSLDGGEWIEADDVRFATVAYTKGNYALVICSVTSFADIDEHRLYTYDPDGKVTDSLVFHRYFVTEDGHGFMPLSGALMGNLDVLTCEIKWLDEQSPFQPEDRNLKGGMQRGQQVDSYYRIDETGRIVLKKQVKYKPVTYTAEDITTFHLRKKDPRRNPVFRYRPAEDIQEVVDF